MKIAALLFRRVGDSLLATPALRAVKKHFPDSELSVFAERNVSRVFQFNTWIDKVIELKPSPSALRLCNAVRASGKPDVVIDFLSDPRSAIACGLSGAKDKIGFDGRGRGWLYNRPIARQNSERPEYSAIHKLRTLEPLGISESDFSTDFCLTESDQDWAERELNARGLENTKLVALFVHSRREFKRWPLVYFADLIQSVRKDGLAEIVLIAAPDDSEYSQKVADLSRLSEQHVIRPNDLGCLGALLKRCAVLVGNDGGPKHIAVAMNTPTVTIFGAEPAEYWTPPNSTQHVAISRLHPHSRLKGQQVLQRISPAEVFDAAKPFLI